MPIFSSCLNTSSMRGRTLDSPIMNCPVPMLFMGTFSMISASITLLVLALSAAQCEVLRGDFGNERNARASLCFLGREELFERLCILAAHPSEEVHFVRCRYIRAP